MTSSLLNSLLLFWQPNTQRELRELSAHVIGQRDSVTTNYVPSKGHERAVTDRGTDRETEAEAEKVDGKVAEISQRAQSLAFPSVWNFSGIHRSCRLRQGKNIYLALANKGGSRQPHLKPLSK